ncbi:hypothetical protein ACIBO2_08440 [Nonomuraea sp. NPDC050022]|uniref:hypothetical protein n=1 Tax=unclassified Nonomuraea TaxID=2593643 RepID=UPI00340740DD
MTVDARTLDELADALDDQAAGGLAWVRVTDRLGRHPVVKGTHRFRTCEAEELWLKILLGQAR